MIPWGNFLVVKSEDILDLERAANTYQGNGMSEKQAKSTAYQVYLKKMHAQAAAYHLDGFDLSKKQKMPTESDKFYAMYCLHANALGLSPYGSDKNPVFETYRKDEFPTEVALFKPHPADDLVLKNI